MEAETLLGTALTNSVIQTLRLRFKRKNNNVQSATFKGVEFYKSISDVLQSTSPSNSSILLDMERVERNKKVNVDGGWGYKQTVFGRVYAYVTHVQLQMLMTSLHPSDQHFYESMHSEQPHKLILDIDRKLITTEGVSTIRMLDVILHTHFIPLLCNFLNAQIGSQLPQGTHISPANFLFMDASRAGYKYSKHILLNIKPYVCAVDRSAEKHLMNIFERQLQYAADLNTSLKKFCWHEEGGVPKCSVDFGIYTSGRRSMRILGSCKGGGAPVRTLRPEGSDLDWKEYMTNTFGVSSTLWTLGVSKPPHTQRRVSQGGSLVVRSARAERSTRDVPVVARSLLLNICSIVHPVCTSVSMSMHECEDIDAQDHEGDAVCMINYARQEGGVRMCAFAEEHTRHYASLTLSPDGRVEYYCFGCRDGIVICDMEVENSLATQGEVVHDSLQAAESSRDIFASLVRSHTLQVNRLALDQYHSRYLKPLHSTQGDNKVLVIKSQMGTGKTHVIANLLDTIPESFSVISIGFRRTLNSSLAARFKLRDYRDVDKTTTMDQVSRLSIQLDSLQKLLVFDEYLKKWILRKTFDIVIVDEVESLLAHFSSSLLQNKIVLRWKVFESVLKNAGRVIMCDADVQAPTILLALSMPHGGVSVIHNYYQPDERTYVFVHNTEIFTKRIMKYVKAGKRLFIASNTKRYVTYISSIIQRRHPAVKVAVIQGSTAPNLKRDMSTNCDVMWSAFDVVICTPAVAAGVDFSALWFDYTFIYGTNGSSNARELKQQSGRVRRTKEDTVYVCIETSNSGKWATHIDVVKDLFDRRMSLTEDANLQFYDASLSNPSLANYVAIRSSVCPPQLRGILCQTEVENNKSTNSMTDELKTLLRDDGKRVVQLPGTPLRYKSVYRRHMLIFEADLLLSQQSAEAPYVMLSDLSTAQTSDCCMFLKSSTCDYFGGVDIKKPELLHVFMKAETRESAILALDMVSPMFLLFQVENRPGGRMHKTTFMDPQQQTHIMQQNIVLEQTMTYWNRKSLIIVALYAAGCEVNVICDHTGMRILDDTNILIALYSKGMNSQLAKLRMQNTHLQAYLQKNTPMYACLLQKPESKIKMLTAHDAISTAKALLKRLFCLPCTLYKQNRKRGLSIWRPVEDRFIVLMAAAILHATSQAQQTRWSGQTPEANTAKAAAYRTLRQSVGRPDLGSSIDSDHGIVHALQTAVDFSFVRETAVLSAKRAAAAAMSRQTKNNEGGVPEQQEHQCVNTWGDFEQNTTMQEQIIKECRSGILCILN